MKTLAVLLFTSVTLIAQSETAYSNHINQHFKGKREAVVPNGRVDILTNEYAIEVERASKWKNSIGQALWYSLQTGKKPGIVILLESTNEYHFVQKLNSSLQHAGIEDQIKVWLYPEDFPALPKMSNTAASRVYSSPATEPADTQKHWITYSSKKRHNSSCRYYNHSKGRFGTANEGTACLNCGG